jgi:thioredoxin-like negative regulator of GroEL
MQQAAEFEAKEQWQQALELYQALLQTDSSLTAAKVKTIPVGVRAALDSQIKAVLDDPLQLSSTNNYNSAQRLLKDASGIANPGPVLQQQVADLSRVLQQATTAVDVVLQSNNQTEVTLFRVAKLGVFAQTSLQLKPGRYIAAGTRMGYRDVRVEFTITGAPIDGPIRVSCDEII